MHGRGQYWYSESKDCIIYVGEFFENTYQGLGKLIYLDGTIYYGSFSNNALCS